MQAHLALLVVFEEHLAVASDVGIAGLVGSLCVVRDPSLSRALFFRQKSCLELIDIVFAVLVGVVSLLA